MKKANVSGLLPKNRKKAAPLKNNEKNPNIVKNLNKKKIWVAQTPWQARLEEKRIAAQLEEKKIAAQLEEKKIAAHFKFQLELEEKKIAAQLELEEKKIAAQLEEKKLAAEEKLAEDWIDRRAVISAEEFLKKIENVAKDQFEKLAIPSLQYLSTKDGHSGLPSQGGNFDARFLSGHLGNESEDSTIVQECLKSFNVTRDNWCDVQMLIGPTGCGKTKAMFDIARKKYCLFVSAALPSQDYSTIPADVAYLLPHSILFRWKLTPKWEGPNRRTLVIETVRDWRLCRILALYHLKKQFHITPEQWLLLQLNGMNWIGPLLEVFNKYRSDSFSVFERDVFKMVTDEIYSDSREPIYPTIPLLLDEAQTWLALLPETFDGTEQKRPFLSPFLEAVNDTYFPLVIAGTNMRLSDVTIVQSVTWKAKAELKQEIELHTSFVCTTPSQCSQFLKYLFQKAGIGLSEEEASIAGIWLQGRLRWPVAFLNKRLTSTTTFFEDLEEFYSLLAHKSNAGMSKFSMWFHMNKMQQLFGNERTFGSLAVLATAYTCRRILRVPPDANLITFSDFGLAFLRRLSTSSDNYYRCTEPGMVFAVKNYFDSQSIVATYVLGIGVNAESQLSPEQPAKSVGFQIEDILGYAIPLECLGKPISQLYDCSNNTIGLPEWFLDPGFKMSSELVVGLTDREYEKNKVKYIPEEFGFHPKSIVDFLNRSDSSLLFRAPSSSTLPRRPDLVALVEYNKNPWRQPLYYFACKSEEQNFIADHNVPKQEIVVAISCKTSSTSTKRDGFLSTDLLFSHQSETEKKEPNQMRDELAKRNFKLVRIHIAFPQTDQSWPGIYSQQPNEVIINIDLSNAHKFLPFKNIATKLRGFFQN